MTAWTTSHIDGWPGGWKRGWRFNRHAMTYVVVNLLLAAINFLKNPNHLWFQWVIFGWGIGLLAHGLNVYSYLWFGSRREQMIQRELQRQERLRQQTPGS